MCSTLIPYFAEPDDIRLNATESATAHHEQPASLSSALHFSSFSSSSSQAALLRSPKSTAPHRVHRRSNVGDHETDTDILEATDVQHKSQQHQSHQSHHSANVSSSTPYESTTTTKPHTTPPPHRSSRDKRSDHSSPSAGSRTRRSGDHRTAANHTNIQRHDANRRPDNHQSLATAARPSHGRRTPSPSNKDAAPNYQEDPVVARLLRRFVSMNVEKMLLINIVLFRLGHGGNQSRLCVGKFGLV